MEGKQKNVYFFSIFTIYCLKCYDIGIKCMKSILLVLGNCVKL